MKNQSTSWLPPVSGALRCAASLALVSALLAGCGGGSLTQVVAPVAPNVAAPAATVQVKLVDSTSQAPLSTASVVVSGSGASAFTGITPGTAFTVSGGLLTLITKDGQAIPSASNPLDLTVASSYSGYETVSVTLKITQGGTQSATLAMVKQTGTTPVTPPAPSTGTLVVAVTKACPDGSNSGTVTDATVSVFSGQTLVATGHAKDGSIQFDGLPATTLSVVASSSATAPNVTKSVTLGTGTVTQLTCNFTLTCAPITGAM